ncbi:Poly(U)-binding-splicing factor puf60 [Geranomyces michiganensis]|nr:Poly(U)-binding-splicing factor puf60 [Geranomyces michiganensis]
MVSMVASPSSPPASATADKRKRGSESPKSATSPVADKRPRPSVDTVDTPAPDSESPATVKRKIKWKFDEAPANPSESSPASPAAAATSAPSPLPADMPERIERAKAYARETTLKLLQSQAKNPLTPGSLLSLATIEGRNVAIMSRIYVGSINFELTEVQLKAVFSRFGYVKAVGMTIDPMTGRHKGFCFVEYEVPEAAELALQHMNGFDLGGRQLKVGRPNNYQHGIGATLPPAVPSRIYIANVNEHVTEENVESIFESFGKIRGCSLLPDLQLRKHKGNGYIEFEEESAADAAISSMDGFELGEMALQVRKSILGGPMPPGMKDIDSLPVVPVIPAGIPTRVLNVAQSINSTLAKRTTGVAAATNPIAAGVGISPMLPANPGINPALRSVLAKVEAQFNEEGASLEENMHISASQRLSIMQKLMRPEAGSTPVTSNIVCLRNMVVVKDLDDDSLNEEISDESSKYGVVSKVLIWVDPAKQAAGTLAPTDPVEIYVKFQSADGAGKAVQAMNGRWFAGKKISASLEDPKVFEEKEPQSHA